MTTQSRIPLAVDVDRIIGVLAAQIYQSPLALLRENTQNAFDAILLRGSLGQSFDPFISITIESRKITIEDNGIGMTKDDLMNHFWRMGASSKNTPAAKAAGVVGTFGIGAMANFGIAEELVVSTESAVHGKRTVTRARRDTLSATRECIDLEDEAPTGEPGTRVTATIGSDACVDVASALQYLRQCVGHVEIPVEVNGTLISQEPLEKGVPAVAEAWRVEEHCRDFGSSVTCDVLLQGSAAGEVGLTLDNISISEMELKGRMILRQGVGNLRAFRKGFALATTSVRSRYQFGGAADFLILEPTAGREALVSDSVQLLQTIVTQADAFTSSCIAERPESDSSTSFMNWVVAHGRYDLCGNLSMRLEPGNRPITLAEIRERTQAQPMLFYQGADKNKIDGAAAEDAPLLVAATRTPRRQCEVQYLKRFCDIQELSDHVEVTKKSLAGYTLAESSFVFHMATVLRRDYFLEMTVLLGQLTHGLPLWVDPSGAKPTLVVDPEGHAARIVLTLYDTDVFAFGGMIKDFVRTHVFPKISSLVPSATKQGAEAFLRRIRPKRHVVEYEASDARSLQEIWDDVISGRLSVEEAAEQSQRVAKKTFQYIERSVARSAHEVVPDVVENETRITAGVEEELELGPTPPIMRDSMTEAKLLTIEDREPSLKGYRCFLAIAEGTRMENGRVLLQPHSTSIVWGGQRALFVFQHHSGRFGLYYDLQASGVISATSGGGLYPTCTIVLQNQVFIPIPDPIRDSFIPGPSERKRFEVRDDLLYTEETGLQEDGAETKGEGFRGSDSDATLAE